MEYEIDYRCPLATGVVRSITTLLSLSQLSPATLRFENDKTIFWLTRLIAILKRPQGVYLGLSMFGVPYKLATICIRNTHMQAGLVFKIKHDLTPTGIYESF